MDHQFTINWVLTVRGATSFLSFYHLQLDGSVRDQLSANCRWGFNDIFMLNIMDVTYAHSIRLSDDFDAYQRTRIESRWRMRFHMIYQPTQCMLMLGGKSVLSMKGSAMLSTLIPLWVRLTIYSMTCAYSYKAQIYSKTCAIDRKFDWLYR